MRSPGGVLAALVIIVSSCGGGGDSVATSTSQPVGASNGAQDGDVIGVYYTGTLDDGSQFDSNVGGTPLVFTIGSGQVISGFEDAVRGRAVGDTFTVRIEPADAYGEHTEENVIALPAEGASPDLQVGDQVQLSNGATVTVLAITADAITVDANHPLAGKALTFEITVDTING